MWWPTILDELNFLSAHVIAGVYFGPAAFDSTESFELFLHAVSELLRRFLDVPDLWVVVLRLVGGAPVPIHELWHIVLPCYSCLSCMAVSHLWSVKVMSATSLIDRLCYSIKILSIPMFNVLGAVRVAGCRNRSASGRRSIDSMNERQNISEFASWCCIWQSEHVPF